MVFCLIASPFSNVALHVQSIPDSTDRLCGQKCDHALKHSRQLGALEPSREERIPVTGHLMDVCRLVLDEMVTSGVQTRRDPTFDHMENGGQSHFWHRRQMRITQ